MSFNASVPRIHDLRHAAYAAGLKPLKQKNAIRGVVHEYNRSFLNLDGYIEYERKVSTATTIAIKCTIDKVDQAITRMVNVLNFLIDFGNEDGEGGVVGYLGPEIRALELARTSLVKEVMLLSYPSLTPFAQTVFAEQFEDLSKIKMDYFDIEELNDLHKD